MAALDQTCSLHLGITLPIESERWPCSVAARPVRVGDVLLFQKTSVVQPWQLEVLLRAAARSELL